MSDASIGPFKDHFSGHASAYAKHRPGYPDALFNWLAAAVSDHQLAWDAGTGNGQVARGLAPYFARIHASDASAGQIAHAVAPENVDFYVAAAESCTLPRGSADLVCVAQALHWFDLARFYAEVKRVLRPGGVFAAWTYQMNKISPAVDQVVDRLYGPIVGDFWPAERVHVENAYLDLPFPFAELEVPGLVLNTPMDLSGFMGYLRTWSAVQRYIAARGKDPLDEVHGALREAWGDAQDTRLVQWPLALRAGRLG